MLAIGLHPTVGPDGVAFPVDHPLHELGGHPLASCSGDRRWRGLLLFAKGDAEFWANEVKLPHWSKPEPCGDHCDFLERSARTPKLDTPGRVFDLTIYCSGGRAPGRGLRS